MYGGFGAIYLGILGFGTPLRVFFLLVFFVFFLRSWIE